jgi:hypothetical protein
MELAAYTADKERMKINGIMLIKILCCDAEWFCKWLQKKKLKAKAVPQHAIKWLGGGGEEV